LKKGFTLIELLVSLTILSLFLSSFFYFFGNQIRATKKLACANTRHQTTLAVLNRMGYEIKAAKKILPTSNPSRLCLQIENDTIEYFISGGEVKRKKNGTTAPLSSTGEISSLSFSYAGNLVETKINDQSLALCLRNQE